MNIPLDKISVSGHETFPFRAGWLRKGLEYATSCDGIPFRDETEAMIRLGVGKNMVRATKHWCIATKTLEETGDRGNPLTVGEVGKWLFEHEFDPYLEDVGSLWLLHWTIATNREKATTWYLAFNLWSQPDFTKESLQRFVSEQLSYSRSPQVSGESIERDVLCFVRTYCRSRSPRSLLAEESLECPLTDLGLISEMADERTLQFGRSEQRSLPDRLLAYMIAEYWTLHHGQRGSLAFDDLMYGLGSPGRVTRLAENAMIERLDRMQEITGDAFHFGSSAGLKQLYRGKGPLDCREAVLAAHYGGAR